MHVAGTITFLGARTGSTRRAASVRMPFGSATPSLTDVQRQELLRIANDVQARAIATHKIRHQDKVPVYYLQSDGQNLARLPVIQELQRLGLVRAVPKPYKISENGPVLPALEVKLTPKGVLINDLRNLGKVNLTGSTFDLLAATKGKPSKHRS